MEMQEEGHPPPQDSVSARYEALLQVSRAIENAMNNQEQERIKEELNKQKAHFEKLFELAPEAIVLRDIHNRVLRANREFTELFGFALEESLGRNINDLILPDEFRAESEILREALARGEWVNAELVRRRKDGRRLTVSFIAAPVTVEGGAPEIYGIYRDITERVRRKYESIICGNPRGLTGILHRIPRFRAGTADRNRSGCIRRLGSAAAWRPTQDHGRRYA
jgi:PAS domain S-box-containing protein